ncbi:fimbrial protein [Serratia liquefaciens]|uniref:Fimbrial protein n=1 Tax=Serratia liquefaciens TaxID=614 RepID=A0A515D5X3_SERLI|nr:fimbrial protein [Serratia liquefaciens]QDL35802.1 fimbrial protein [Serratia liquefaciens]
MKIIISLMVTLLLSSWSFNVWSFACRTIHGDEIPIGGGEVDVYVNLAPEISLGYNLVIDLSSEILCRNDRPRTIIDYVSLEKGSAYGGALSNFTGMVLYAGTSYGFPVTAPTKQITYTSGSYTPWPTILYLTPVSTAGGVIITPGSLIARLTLGQTNDFNGDHFPFVWNIYAKNSVVIPTGGCDVSSRDVNVTLAPYPAEAKIPLTVNCERSNNISFFLTGITDDSNNSIFTNTEQSSPAVGVGIQISRNGIILPAHKNVSLGYVGYEPISLDLTAKYASASGVFMGGKVRSIIGVNFVYD